MPKRTLSCGCVVDTDAPPDKAVDASGCPEPDHKSTPGNRTDEATGK